MDKNCRLPLRFVLLLPPPSLLGLLLVEMDREMDREAERVGYLFGYLDIERLERKDLLDRFGDRLLDVPVDLYEAIDRPDCFK